jgi:hypothetical protein
LCNDIDVSFKDAERKPGEETEVNVVQTGTKLMDNARRQRKLKEDRERTFLRHTKDILGESDKSRKLSGNSVDDWQMNTYLVAIDR